MKHSFWLLLVSILVLPGCVSREQADAKLAKGCAAAAKAFLDEGYEIKEIKKKTFGESSEFGAGYREVTLAVMEYDGWYEDNKIYKCIFAEEFGIAGTSHSASIYQLKINGQTYGKEGNKILGTMQDQMKLNNAVEDAMR